MANMWPISFPYDLNEEPKRRAEFNVYEKLEQILDNSFYVFYECWWYERNRVPPDGECDFVIAHSQREILFLEVKGGEVKFNRENRQWTTRPRARWTTRIQDPVDIKDPVEQVQKSESMLIQKLKETGWRKGQNIHTCHGVILPASFPPEGFGDLAPDELRELFWCQEDFDRDKDGTWIRNRMKGLGNDGSHDGICALKEILAQPLSFKRLLQGILAADDRMLKRLTKEQVDILEDIRGSLRVAISAPAGTGKTILALWEAARQAKDGRRVLFVCFNRALKASVERELEELEELGELEEKGKKGNF